MQTQTPRSPARARYYKPAAQRPLRTQRSGNAAARQSGEANTNANSHVGLSQRMALQAIICGGVLAVMLMLNIINTPPTDAATAWVAHNISRDMLTEIESEGWLGDIIGFFGGNNEIADDTDAVPTAAYTPTDVETPAPNEATPADAANPNASRIDENIMREIMSAVDVYYENNR